MSYTVRELLVRRTQWECQYVWALIYDISTSEDAL